MNCARARFLIYAYLDRELSLPEGESLSRHLAECGSCSARAASARGLARVLHSRVDRRPVPPGLLARLRAPWEPALKPRYPVFAAAAALVVMLLPLASDVGPRASIAASELVPGAAPIDVRRTVPRRMTGTFVCLECEARAEAGLCPVSHVEHPTGFCADNGELWRLMPSYRVSEGVQTSVGQTATVEGVAFPQSGFMRVSRVGY